jgi:DNA-directed RNA polymerase alpha subunit
MTYDEIGKSLGLSSSRAAQIENRARRLLRQIIWTGYRIHCQKNRRQIELISIDELSMDARSRSAVMKLGVSTIGNLAAISPCQLLAVKNFGMTSLDRLRSSLAIFGLDLMRCPIHGMCCASCKETGGKWVSRFNPAIGKLEQVRPWVCAQD